MMKSGNLIRNNLYFFIPYLLLLMVGFILNLSLTQKTLFFFLNTPHAGFDPVMEYYTNVGDGVFSITVVVILLFVRIRYALIGALAFLLQGGLVQLLKQFIFPHHPRPWSLYGNSNMIHVVQGYVPYTSNSFPSGHTATAFAMFALMAFFTRDKWLGLVFFFLALMVGYSRVYLAQHFFVDAYAGSIVGVFSATVIYMYFYRARSGFTARAWLDKPLHKLRS